MPPATHVGPTCLPSTEPMFERDSLTALQEDRGIEWRLSLEPPPPAPPVLEPEPSRFSTPEKVVLFRRLFRGTGCADDRLRGAATASYPSTALLARVATLFEGFTLRCD